MVASVTQSDDTLSEQILLGISNVIDVIAHDVQVIAMEVFAVLFYVIPAGFQWLYQRYTGDISYIQMQEHGSLYLHGTIDEIEETTVKPIIFCHGDFGHPLTLLPLITIARQKLKNPIFSLFIPDIHNNAKLQSHSDLMGKVMNRIKELVSEHNKTFNGFLGVGHSKGAILLAERQLLHPEDEITSIFAVGGRLYVPEGDQSCKPLLKPFVQKIFTEIQKSNLPIFQIVPELDWCAPREAFTVKPDANCYIVPRSHLSGLYTSRTVKIFKEFFK